jgi:monovalent cation:H+ antiporter, CPA1 family
METFLRAETLIIELLLIVALVAMVVRRIRIPYTVALVVAGLLITFRQELTIELKPELILVLFVPPLVFEAAFHIEFRHLREAIVPILALAIPGVLLTTALVGLLVNAGTGLPIKTALVFGALMAATDPVAVVALFRALGVAKRLAVLVEGESLLNDGTAIVVFNLMLAAAIPAAGGASNGFDLTHAIVEFGRVSLGGVGIGLGLGLIVAKLIDYIDDYLIETTLTTVLAFGSYLLAERLHVSGVLAVVIAGMVCGNVGPNGMSPTTKIVLFNFWEYLAFVANSLVFLLIGLDVNIPQILNNFGPITIAVGAVLIARALVVYGLNQITRIFGRGLPATHQHVLFWGGLRGAISLALVLSIPATLAERDTLRVMAYGVVLFTLLAQGTTMQYLLSRLGLSGRSEDRLEYERHHGRLLAARAAHDRVQALYRSGLLSSATWEDYAPELEAGVRQRLDEQRQLLQEKPRIQKEELRIAEQEGLRAQRALLISLHGAGVLSDTVYEELVTDVDEALGGEDATND